MLYKHGAGNEYQLLSYTTSVLYCISKVLPFDRNFKVFLHAVLGTFKQVGKSKTKRKQEKIQTVFITVLKR